MDNKHSTEGNFNYNNVEKKDKNFMYKNLDRSVCYKCDFSNSKFDYVNFRGAHFKFCTFYKCSFKWAEFIGANLKNSNLKNAVFENTVFDSAKLEGANFKDAEFKNTIFYCTDLQKVKNLDINDPGIRIIKEMPQLDIKNELHEAVLNAMNNRYVKASRVLNTKDGGINFLNIMILLENFDEVTLIKGLNIIAAELNKDFYTLSYIIKYLKTLSSLK